MMKYFSLFCRATPVLGFVFARYLLLSHTLIFVAVSALHFGITDERRHENERTTVVVRNGNEGEDGVDIEEQDGVAIKSASSRVRLPSGHGASNKIDSSFLQETTRNKMATTKKKSADDVLQGMHDIGKTFDYTISHWVAHWKAMSTVAKELHDHPQQYLLDQHGSERGMDWKTFKQLATPAFEGVVEQHRGSVPPPSAEDCVKDLWVSLNGGGSDKTRLVYVPGHPDFFDYSDPHYDEVHLIDDNFDKYKTDVLSTAEVIGGVAREPHLSQHSIGPDQKEFFDDMTVQGQILGDSMKEHNDKVQEAAKEAGTLGSSVIGGVIGHPDHHELDGPPYDFVPSRRPIVDHQESVARDLSVKVLETMAANPEHYDVGAMSGDEAYQSPGRDASQAATLGPSAGKHRMFAMSYDQFKQVLNDLQEQGGDHDVPKDEQSILKLWEEMNHTVEYPGENKDWANERLFSDELHAGWGDQDADVAAAQKKLEAYDGAQIHDHMPERKVLS